MALLTNNLAKHAGLGGHRLEMGRRAPVSVEVSEDNLKYLLTKRERTGHELPWLDEYMEPHGTSAEGAQQTSGAGPSEISVPDSAGAIVDLVTPYRNEEVTRQLRREVSAQVEEAGVVVTDVTVVGALKIPVVM